jgi:hypothetical protein
MSQLPVVLVPVTVIVPVGVPDPGAVTATLAPTLTAWPTTDGSGLSEPIETLVFALLTVCAVDTAVLDVLKLPSPLYVALMVCGPRAVKTKLHDVVVPRFMLQLPVVFEPVTVIVPVGVPAPGAVTATLAPTLTL